MKLKILVIILFVLQPDLTAIDKQLREERKAKIFSMYLAGYTMQEIANAVGVERSTVTKDIEGLVNISSLAKNHQVLTNFQDSEFETPIMVSENPTHYHNLP